MTFLEQLRHNRLFMRSAWLVLLIVLMLHNALTTSQIELPRGFDARAYVAAARAIRSGQDPTAPQTSTLLPELGVRPTDGKPPVPEYLYPPTLALLLSPFAAVPLDDLLLGWVVLIGLCMLLMIPFLQRIVGWPIAILAVLGFEQAWVTVWMGQINGIIALLMTLALLDLQRGRTRWSGIWLAAGALIKITPGVGLVVLAIRRDWRAVIAAILLGLAVVGLTLPLVGLDVWIHGVLYALTQTWTMRGLLSWTALLHRALGQPGFVLGYPIMLFFVAATLVRARHVSPALALSAAFLLPMLIARITWEHHAVMALPAFAILWQIGGRARIITGCAWLGLTLVGGLALPLGITLCWVACCWPEQVICEQHH